MILWLMIGDKITGIGGIGSWGVLIVVDEFGVGGG